MEDEEQEGQRAESTDWGFVFSLGETQLCDFKVRSPQVL